jgi:HEAT repeat protein
MRALPVIVATLLFIPASFAQEKAPQDKSNDELIKQLKAKDATVRLVAAEALGRQKVEAAIPALGETLQDKDLSVREAAAGALLRIGAKSLPALAKALKYPDEFSRILALRVLRALGPEAKAAVPDLADALRDKNVDVRIHAADILGNLKSDARAALPKLYEAARDTSPGVLLEPLLPDSVAEAAVAAAFKIDSKCGPELAKIAVPALIEALKSKESDVVQTAAKALGMIGQDARVALPALVEAYKLASQPYLARDLSEAATKVGGDATVHLTALINDARLPLEKRLAAMEDLGLTRDAGDKAVAVLVDALKDPEPKLRAGAAHALSFMGPRAKSAIAPLIKKLDDEKLDAAAKSGFGSVGVVAFALGSIGSEAAQPVADYLKNEQNPAFARWQAAAALSVMGRKARKVMPVMEGVFHDESIVIAVEAGYAYVRAGGAIAKVLPLLKEGLDHEKTFAVWTTAEVVERLGPQVREMVPLLLKLLEHQDMEVRIKAAQALSVMGTDAKPGVSVMAKLLEQDNRRQRIQILGALTNLGPNASAAVPAIVPLVKEPDKFLSERALAALTSIGPGAGDAVQPLVALLSGMEPVHREAIIRTLGRIGPAAKLAVPKLTEFLTHENVSMRLAAAQALGGIGPKAGAAVGELKKLLADPNKSVRAYAACSLGLVTEYKKSAADFLVSLWRSELEAGSAFASTDIAQALALLGADARPARDLLLAAVLEDRMPPLQYQAAQALGHLPEEADVIVPKLVSLTERKTNNELQRSSNCVLVARCLGQLGPAAKAAIPRLRQLADDDDNDIADAAAAALTRIEGKK